MGLLSFPPLAAPAPATAANAAPAEGTGGDFLACLNLLFGTPPQVLEAGVGSARPSGASASRGREELIAPSDEEQMAILNELGAAAPIAMWPVTDPVAAPFIVPTTFANVPVSAAFAADADRTAVSSNGLAVRTDQLMIGLAVADGAPATTNEHGLRFEKLMGWAGGVKATPANWAFSATLRPDVSSLPAGLGLRASDPVPHLGTALSASPIMPQNAAPASPTPTLMAPAVPVENGLLVASQPEPLRLRRAAPTDSLAGEEAYRLPDELRGSVRATAGEASHDFERASAIPSLAGTPVEPDLDSDDSSRQHGERHGEAAAMLLLPSVDRQANMSALDESASVGETTPVAPPEVPEPRIGLPRPAALTLRLGGLEQDVRIRLAQTGGQMRVDVHALDAQLATTLGGELGDLVTKLDQAGYEAVAWSPSSATIEVNTTEETTGADHGSAEEQPDGRPDQQHGRPRRGPGQRRGDTPQGDE